MKTRDHGGLTVIQFPCLNDNYGFVVRDDASGKVATIDTPDAAAIARVLDQQGWGLDFILNTHWHADHTGGNEALKKRFDAKIVGPAAEGDRIPGRDLPVGEGDVVALGDSVANVIATPGHTMGHIIYHFEQAQLAFVGDTLFSLGCGRLFEGTAEQMWSSLSKVRSLPPETVLYCAHEYTAANAKFSLSVEPNHEGLIQRSAEIAALRAKGEPTVPIVLSDEIKLNPFLRADDPALAAKVGKADAAPAEVFGEIRSRKDRF